MRIRTPLNQAVLPSKNNNDVDTDTEQPNQCQSLIQLAPLCENGELNKNAKFDKLDWWSRHSPDLLPMSLSPRESMM